jgi:hypothetical protein
MLFSFQNGDRLALYTPFQRNSNTPLSDCPKSVYVSERKDEIIIWSGLKLEMIVMLPKEIKLQDLERFMKNSFYFVNYGPMDNREKMNGNYDNILKSEMIKERIKKMIRGIIIKDRETRKNWDSNPIVSAINIYVSGSLSMKLVKLTFVNHMIMGYFYRRFKSVIKTKKSTYTVTVMDDKAVLAYRNRYFNIIKKPKTYIEHSTFHEYLSKKLLKWKEGRSKLQTTIEKEVWDNSDKRIGNHGLLHPGTYIPVSSNKTKNSNFIDREIITEESNFLFYVNYHDVTTFSKKVRYLTLKTNGLVKTFSNMAHHEKVIKLKQHRFMVNIKLPSQKKEEDEKKKNQITKFMTEKNNREELFSTYDTKIEKKRSKKRKREEKEKNHIGNYFIRINSKKRKFK